MEDEERPFFVALVAFDGRLYALDREGDVWGLEGRAWVKKKFRYKVE